MCVEDYAAVQPDIRLLRTWSMGCDFVESGINCGSYGRTCCLHHLKADAAGYSEAFVILYHITSRHISQGIITVSWQPWETHPTFTCQSVTSIHFQINTLDHTSRHINKTLVFLPMVDISMLHRLACYPSFFVLLFTFSMPTRKSTLKTWNNLS